MTGLYDKLSLAAKYKMNADDAKVMIEDNAVIDTANVADKKALMMADMALQKGTTINIDELRNAERVIYWKIKDDGHNVIVGGLAWHSGSVYAFSGKILTP